MDAWLLSAFASGITAHILLYRHGEWDVKSLLLVQSYGLLLVLFYALERMTVLERFLDIETPTYWAFKTLGCHVLGIYLSMLCYRAFWHRLSRFPGPYLARLSNFYVTALTAKKFQLYNEVEDLHRKYGDYVRLGPTELSIADPRAVKALYSGVAKVGKGPWYTVLEPRVSLHMERDKKTHARRRKIPVNFKLALRDYEPRVAHYTDQLVAAIEKSVDVPMDMTAWFNYYSFDIMGDLSFGKSFDMLVDGKEAYILKKLHADMQNIGLFSHLTWLFPFFKRIPGLNADYLKFWDWVGEQVKARIDNRPDRPDVFSWILDAFERGPKTMQDLADLYGDAYLIIVAGSDTTAATLTNLFFHIAHSPKLQKQLQAELDALPDLSHESLVGVKFLDALVNETLRLHPAVPSGTQRMTPPEGISIGDQYIPGDVMVCIPSHTLFRDARVFERPEEFLPERWTTQPELVKDPSAFIPFNAGPYSCVGKQLALMELRRVVAEVFTRYGVCFAPGQTEAAFLGGKKDTFTLAAGPLELVFSRREGGVQVN
ncbi:cytochrome P450 monooxygenase [Aspergillus unguis]